MQYEILCFRTSLNKLKEIRTNSILSCRIHSNTSIKFLNGGFELYLSYFKVIDGFSKSYRVNIIYSIHFDYLSNISHHFVMVFIFLICLYKK